MDALNDTGLLTFKDHLKKGDVYILKHVKGNVFLLPVNHKGHKRITCSSKLFKLAFIVKPKKK